MIGIDDLFNIANVMDQQMLLINVKHKKDFRDNLIINFELPSIDFQAIDEQLYEREHNTLVGYEKGDEVDINIIGINFKLRKKEDQ